MIFTKYLCAAAAMATSAVLTGFPAPPAAAAPIPSIHLMVIEHQMMAAQHAVPLPAPLFYRVRAGDSLSVIARHELGKAGDWPLLWWANRTDVRNPDLIPIGERLILPPRSRHLHTYMIRDAMRGIPAPIVVVVAQNTPETPLGNESQAVSAPNPPPVQGQVSTSGDSGFQACVIQAESGGNAGAVNATSGAGGLYQFLPSTWAALGFSGLPENASVAVQNEAFAKEYAQGGTSAWAPYDGC